MLSPRWMKLLRDVRQAPGRIALMVLAMSLGVAAVATMLSSYSILARETRRNYLATNPPSATLNLDNIDARIMAEVRAFPGIKEAQAGSTVGAVLQTVGGQSLPLLIFVVDDFKAMSINTVYREAGAWPPAPGQLLLEREALMLIKASIGDKVNVKTADGALHAVPIGGTLHDPGLPPATRGQTVYAYATPDTLTAIGLNGTLRNLKLTVADKPFDIEAIEATVARLAVWLDEHGYPVTRIRIPPPGEHPHQSIMTSLQTMLIIFAGIALVLGAVLSATILGGMLAHQRRQIGVMKTVGARSGQIARLYLALVLAMATLATLIGTLAGLAAGRAWSSVVLQQILNFTMASDAVPHWLLAMLLVSGIGIPLLPAAVPIRQATRATVADAISDAGSSRQWYAAGARWLEHLPLMDRTLLMALRNSVRRRARLLLTLGLLGVAGAMFISSLNVRRASEQHLVQAAADRRHDVETILVRPADIGRTKAIICAVPGVARVEEWRRTSAARARPDGLEIERVYPDGAHGTLTIASVPEPTDMLKLAMLQGRWLAPGETGTAVLNNVALEFFPNVKVGDTVALSTHGKTEQLRIVGIARQHMAGANVFVTPASFNAFTKDPTLADTYRIVLTAHDEASIDRATRTIEDALAAAGTRVRLSVTETMLRKDVDGHFDLLIAAMLFISILMALVGGVGLASAMGTNVAERSREFGIMRSIGASPRVVLRNVLAEGVFVGMLSVPLAVMLALPLSFAIGDFLGNMLFGLGFPLVLSPKAVALWVALVAAGSVTASSIPAVRASRLRVQQTLSYQ